MKLRFGPGRWNGAQWLLQPLELRLQELEKVRKAECANKREGGSMVCDALNVGGQTTKWGVITMSSAVHAGQMHVSVARPS
jgi:hypothetical protein